MATEADGGFTSLARLMAASPETAIFRQFKELYMLNLLRLQSEVHSLEVRLLELQQANDKEATANGPSATTLLWNKNFSTLRERNAEGIGEEYELLKTIGEKLNEYHSTVLQTQQMANLDQPLPREVDFLKRSCLRRSEGTHSLVAEHELRVWDVTADLVTLAADNKRRDAFYWLFDGLLMRMSPNSKRRKQQPKLLRRARTDTTLREERQKQWMLEAASEVFGTVLSSMLPTVAILVLYFVHNSLVRIGLVIVFTFCFSIALALFTSARKVEIFSATAAFAAVEVVFIGTSG